jgi:hypothetical protein
VPVLTLEGLHSGLIPSPQCAVVVLQVRTYHTPPPCAAHT